MHRHANRMRMVIAGEKKNSNRSVSTNDACECVVRSCNWMQDRNYAKWWCFYACMTRVYSICIHAHHYDDTRRDVPLVGSALMDGGHVRLQAIRIWSTIGYWFVQFLRAAVCCSDVRPHKRDICLPLKGWKERAEKTNPSEEEKNTPASDSFTYVHPFFETCYHGRTLQPDSHRTERDDRMSLRRHFVLKKNGVTTVFCAGISKGVA